MDQYLDKLSPENVKANLMRASLFLTAFELLQLELVDQIQEFYATDFDEAGHGKESNDYRKEVLPLAPLSVHPNTERFLASCAWWVTNGTLTLADVEEIKAIKKHRNLIAHELPKIIIDPAFSVNWHLFARLRHFVKVLALFWRRVAIDSLEQFDGQEISDADMQSGLGVLIDYIDQVVSPPST